MRSRIVLLFATVLTVLTLAGCSEANAPNATERDNEANAEGYESVSQAQPAETMDYSPTREGINKWVRTWEEPGKISYVYIINQSGVSYLVLEGLPISYAARNTPPEKIVDVDEEVGNSSVDAMAMQQPGMDAAYYQGSNAVQYYGFEAQTGTYVEFSVGGDQNFYVSEKPLPKFSDAQPIGSTTIEDTQK